MTGLRVALLCYRGAPHCGGQGVYVRHLSRELVALGHRVEVIAGPPYPVVDPGVGLTRLPGLELFAEPNPFRTPRLRELRTVADWVEFAEWKVRRSYPEPLAFSLRARKLLDTMRGEFDIVHDNQGLGYGLLGIDQLIATIHHPIAVDRDITLAHTTGDAHRGARRWYRFTAMQHQVARRLPAVLTVSASARRDVVDLMGVNADRVTVIPPGVDRAVFRPRPSVRRVPGRIVTLASADVPLKGLRYLLDALPRVPDAELIVVGNVKGALPDRVTVRTGLSEHELADLLCSAEVACVPSLYEGFALPAIEAMACGTPLVVSDGGALPEVVGDCGVVVPAGDSSALASALRTLLNDHQLRRELGNRGVVRASGFTWRATAEATAQAYRLLLNDQRNGVTC